MMEPHTFDVFFDGFCKVYKAKGWPTPDRAAILAWEDWKAELVKQLEAIEAGERKMIGQRIVARGFRTKADARRFITTLKVEAEER